MALSVSELVQERGVLSLVVLSVAELLVPLKVVLLALELLVQLQVILMGWESVHLRAPLLARKSDNR